MSLTREDRLRAWILGVVLLIQGVDALPSPRALGEQELKSSVVRAELDRWVPVARTFGLADDRAELVEWVNRVAGGWGEVSAVLEAPAAPWRKYTGTGQDWALFAFPETAPRGIRIEGRADGVWRPLYVPWDKEHAFLRETLMYRRFRGLVDGQSRRPSSTWNHFAEWAADRAFAEWPELDAARIKLTEQEVRPPGEPRAPVTEWYVRHRERGAAPSAVTMPKSAPNDAKGAP